MHFSAEERAELLNKLDEFFARAKVDDTEANVFRQLYRQFLEETHYIDWNSWKFIADDVQRNHADLPNFDASRSGKVSISYSPTEKYKSAKFVLRKDVLDRLIVVKLNGGLGTTMGCDGPKSFIEVKDNLSFLDIARQQHEVFNKTHNSNVPLYLMNSFYTEEQTRQELGANSGVQTFCQSKCPRIWADSLLPVQGTGTNQEWYPPGHGNIFHALSASGVLDELLSQGRDIMFVSNIDNTGATLDLKIAQFACDEAVDYIMECTEKTQNDIKGGTLIDIAGQLMHLEIPQVPPEHLDEFCSTRTFKIFNTNNIWVNLRAVKERLGTISSEIIVNKKTLNGRGVIQLETSIGGCIRNFPRAYCVHVGRHRFLPVKKSDDLLAISSNLYSLSAERSLVLNRNRPAPTVELGKFFQNVDDFHARFDDYPDILELDSLKVEGDVRFEKGVTLKGNVHIVNKSERQQTITAGSCINNEKIVFE